MPHFSRCAFQWDTTPLGTNDRGENTREAVISNTTSQSLWAGNGFLLDNQSQIPCSPHPSVVGRSSSTRCPLHSAFQVLSKGKSKPGSLSSSLPSPGAAATSSPGNPGSSNEKGGVHGRTGRAWEGFTSHLSAEGIGSNVRFNQPLKTAQCLDRGVWVIFIWIGTCAHRRKENSILSQLWRGTSGLERQAAAHLCKLWRWVGFPLCFWLSVTLWLLKDLVAPSQHLTSPFLFFQTPSEQGKKKTDWGCQAGSEKQVFESGPCLPLACWATLISLCSKQWAWLSICPAWEDHSRRGDCKLRGLPTDNAFPSVQWPWMTRWVSVPL